MVSPGGCTRSPTASTANPPPPTPHRRPVTYRANPPCVAARCDGSASYLRAVEVQVRARRRGPTLPLVTRPVLLRAVGVLGRRGEPEEAQLADLHPRPELDRQRRHIG